MREPQRYVHQEKVCYYCGSSNCQYAYLDNNKEDQPRYRCLNIHCRQLFTFGSHSNRPRGKKYDKSGALDVRDLPRECPRCGSGEAKDTPFKYYNNNKGGSNKTQPRFHCLRCKKSFQMRLITNGTERHLEHSKSRTQSMKKGLANAHELPEEMPENDMDMADSMEVNNGDLVDMDIFDGALAEMGFDDHAPGHGLIPDESMFDDRIYLSDFTLPLSVRPDNINPPPSCAAKETSWLRDVEAALMTNDIEDDMIMSSEAYQSIIVEFPALDSQGSLEVPEADQSFASELEEALLEDDVFASELEETLLEDAEAEQNRAACLRECRRQYEHARQITWLPSTADPTTLALRVAVNEI